MPWLDKKPRKEHVCSFPSRTAMRSRPAGQRWKCSRCGTVWKTYFDTIWSWVEVTN